MQSEKSVYINRANDLLVWRFYWFAVILVAFATTFFWGVAPTGFLGCSLGCGAVGFACLLFSWRFRSFVLDLAVILLFAFVPRALSLRYGLLPLGAMFWQGFLLSLLLIAFLLALLAPVVRRICQLPAPAA